MKQLRNFKKKASVLLLAVAMTVTAFPQLGTTVYASELPDVSQFAIKEELKSFNTDDTDGEVKSAKVYFGNNNQQWWIAGSQNDNLTLFAVSPLSENVRFNDSRADKNYNGTSVWCTHYGASVIKSGLNDLETNTAYFSVEEQDLMKDTTIYTNDAKNNTVYATTNKLYLAYGETGNRFITVGQNEKEKLSMGLTIQPKFWWKNDFWLRNSRTDEYCDIDVAVAWSNGTVGGGAVTSKDKPLLPAFQMDMSSIAFGSTASCATSDGQVTTNDAMTLRYNTNTLGSALVSYDKSKVELTGVPVSTYLVAQNNTGAYAKSVSGTASVLPSDMGLESFRHCKIWLETTDTTNRITSATLADEEPVYSINIAENMGLNITSDNGSQEILQGKSISNITVEIAQSYYLPDDYVNHIKGLNGLTVTETDTGFTISGTPNADVNITLPEATAMPKAPTPTVSIGRTKNTLTVNGTFDTDTYGDVEYKWDNGAWGTSAVLSDLEAGSEHTVAVCYKGKGIYLQSDVATVTVSTKKDGENAEIVEPENLTGVYGQTLEDVTLPVGWTWENKNTSLSVGTESFKAHYDTTSSEDEYDFTDVEEYNAQGHYVERSLSIQVSKADTSIEIKANTMDKAYDGQTMAEPEVEKTGSTKDVVITWYQKEADGNYTELASAPKVVSNYKVKASVEADANYNSASAEKEFVISIAANEWKDNLSITGWTYGKKANIPTATAKFGTVEFTYSNAEDGTYTDVVPANAGTWYVKASVAGTENYTDLESAPAAFKIAKAVPVCDIPQGLMMKQGNSLSTVDLPDGFVWADDTQVLDELGEHTVKAVFTPEDADNYGVVEVDITVKVVPPMTPLNSIPTIQAKDKTLNVGDKFDPLADVSAFDKEDGDLTKDIKVIENTVDMAKAGTYKVVYQVVDSQKATATKTITVTVKEKASSQDTGKKPEKDNKPKKDDNTQTGVKTGDTYNLFFWGMAAMLAAFSIIIVTCKKRKRNFN